MLTKLTVRNFKRFEEVDIQLDNPVVFVGPNNSGKTTAMQALALWELGLRRWTEKFSGKSVPKRRPGVAINRRDLLAAPVPRARELWKDLSVRLAGNQNVCIEIIVEGHSEGTSWTCGLEFDYVNEESLYCRPLRTDGEDPPARMSVPDAAKSTRVALLPPMSGLAANETRLDQGAINVRIGEGRTAEVLRNLCYKISNDQPALWDYLIDDIRTMFGVLLNDPEYVVERGEVAMTYKEGEVDLDLSASGRGMQQTLLLLAYIYTNPGTILLLDEPDAHLEILRQREVYTHIVDAAARLRAQLVTATHSEVILNASADQHLVIAFIGKPHPIGSRISQVRKALKDFGWQHYALAEQTGWVLYLEGNTDLKILNALAKRTKDTEGIEILSRPFVHEVANDYSKVSEHFFALKETVPHLKGIALFDNLHVEKPDLGEIEVLMWNKREIENYLCTRRTLMSFATSQAELVAESATLFDSKNPQQWIEAMDNAIELTEQNLEFREEEPIWSSSVKASDDVLVPLFRSYYRILGEYNEMPKGSLYRLADHIPDEEIDPEVCDKIDAIARVGKSARAGC